MPKLEVSLDLDPAQPDVDWALICLLCLKEGCEWKVRLPLGAEQARVAGLHSRCKIALETRRSISTSTLPAVKP